MAAYNVHFTWARESRNYLFAKYNFRFLALLQKYAEIEAIRRIYSFFFHFSQNIYIYIRWWSSFVLK